MTGSEHHGTTKIAVIDLHREFIFGVNRPFTSCHASTLILLDNGDIVAAWFGGSREGADDTAIWISRQNGGKWSSPVKVADEENLPHWNPVLFADSHGRIFLFYKVGRTIPDWTTRCICSDDGLHWSLPHPLVEGDIGGRGPVKNKPIRLKSGVWLAPASTEGDRWEAFVDISRDEGQSWEKSPAVPLGPASGTQLPGNSLFPVPLFSVKGKGIIQPTLWESKPDIVHMLLRSTEGVIFGSDSKDGGSTWYPAYPTLLPNNNSGIDLVCLDGGLLILAHNPVGINGGERTPLVLSSSNDNGASWQLLLVLENSAGEYSYPAVIADKNRIMVTYTWNREQIAFCTFEVGITDYH